MIALNRWSRWRSFPDPKKGGFLSAPFGPGVYQLRNWKTRELVLFGKGKNVAHRMSSLLPRPLGAPGRTNEQKKEYVLDNFDKIEYRAKACESEDEATNEERSMRRQRRLYFQNMIARDCLMGSGAWPEKGTVRSAQ